MSEEKLEQYWDIKVFKDNPTFPFVVFDNWYTPEEEKAVWKELDFVSSQPREKTERAETTVVAKKNGIPLSHAFRYYIDEWYSEQHIARSTILSSTYKLREKELHKHINQCLPYSRYYTSTNRESTLLSYYENKDYYKPHHDTFAWTILVWMVREPRQFDGGDFTLNDIDTEVKLKSNRAVLFPCCYEHSVSPIKFKNQPKEIGYGRYTITHFLYSVPSG